MGKAIAFDDKKHFEQNIKKLLSPCDKYEIARGEKYHFLVDRNRGQWGENCDTFYIFAVAYGDEQNDNNYMQIDDGGIPFDIIKNDTKKLYNEIMQFIFNAILII